MAGKLIALFLSFVFALSECSIAVFFDNKIEISKSEKTLEYYVDGESEDGKISYGVVSDLNLFEPGEELCVVFESADESLYGTRGKISVASEQADISRTGYFVFDNKPAQYIFSFSSELNGIFTITLKTVKNKEYSFNVGVMPENLIASDNFYYGIQPYITRAKVWDENYRVPGFNADESVDLILNYAEYLGVNLIREDGVSWGSMQSGPYADMNFDIQDGLVSKTNARGIKYNWILGSETNRWGLSDAYKDVENIQNIWAYPPDEDMWADYVTKLADHYGDNENILWEIWNKPDWEFFSGTQEEYFSILESTAAILKNTNPNLYVYTGGLAQGYRESILPYYLKSNELICRGLLDNWAYHNHNGSSDFAEKIRATISLAKSAGLKCGGINSESGVGGADGCLIARKALYTRSLGSDGYVSFSFRKTVNDSGDVSDFAFFNEFMQPGNAVLTFATVIRFLGDSDYIRNRSDKEDVIIDEYSTEKGTVLVCYAFGTQKTIAVPENAYECYDMYGNPIKLRKNIKISEEPIYIFVK